MISGYRFIIHKDSPREIVKLSAFRYHRKHAEYPIRTQKRFDQMIVTPGWVRDETQKKYRIARPSRPNLISDR